MLFTSCDLFAQSSNERKKIIVVSNNLITLDSLSIIPGSVIIKQETGINESDSLPIYRTIDSSLYTIDHFHSTIQFSEKATGQVLIEYKVFPYLFTKKYFNKNPDLFDSANINLTPYSVSLTNIDPYLNITGLDYSGSFARGISFGNNQDIVVNSNFNLQMNGKLQNDVNINASITDNNIPIQPEGNTQQLQEFDKVFIQLSKNKQTLTMGDYEIYKPKSYFLNYYKKLQGVSYSGGFDLENKGSLTTGLNLAVAKGIYAKQDLTILEGNQGPYKLKGNNGETFIIILAGTERVYIDGKLMVRGSENDYIIDYNAGEITFTPNVLLTKDKRVQVEFEYSDKNYFRTLVFSGSEYTSENEKLKLRLNIYAEQDSKNQPLDQTIDSFDKSILEAVGDSVQYAFSSGIDTIAFDASRIMYKMVDSLGFDSVFVYSANPDSAKYVLSFTELGLNNGNYIQSATFANGRVYTWVAPIDGIPQGYAEPVILLNAPKKSQMVTAAADYRINENNFITGEIAVTNNDVNTFSEINNADNSALAYRTEYQNLHKFSEKTILSSSVNYEFTEMNFAPPERYRPVEFNRDWNIFSTEKTNEHYTNANFNLAGGDIWNIGLQSSAFIREKNYTGFLQALKGTVETKQWIINASSSYLNSNADTIQSNFLRPNLSVAKIFPAINYWKLGVNYEGEHNNVYSESDSLLSNSFYYDQFKYFISNADTAVNKFYADVIMRNDRLPVNGKFADITRGNTYTLSGALNENVNNRISWQLSYRNLEIVDTSLTFLEPEKSLLGRLQNAFVIKKGLITSDIFYELGTGQEPKKEYTFIEVEPGVGNYTWNDYNTNGIPELNEFEIAAFADEGNYIQVFIPTDEYIQSNVSNFNYAIGLNPKVLLFNKPGFAGFIGKFAAQSSLQLTRKVLDDQSFNSYVPFTIIDDSLLVSSNMYWLNTIYFNRSSPKFGIDYSYLENFSKQVITIGPESRGKAEHKINMRYKIATPFTLNLAYTNGNKLLISEAFMEKNYTIPYFTIEPKLTYIKGSVFRTSVFYQYTKSDNTEGVENLLSHEFTFDIRYNVVSKSTITSKISLVNIKFNGIEDSPVGYAILEGLQDGNNILWNLNIDRKLSAILQLTVSYEGRKTGDSDITHLGRLQMRAVF